MNYKLIKNQDTFIKECYFGQHGELDCGPASLMMICKFYLMKVEYQEILSQCLDHKEGSTLRSLVNTAKNLNFEVKAIETIWDYNFFNSVLPCILWVFDSHYNVLFKMNEEFALVGDPEKDISYIKIDDLVERFQQKDKNEGIALLMCPRVQNHDK